jgi:hypothetical protein
MHVLFEKQEFYIHDIKPITHPNSALDYKNAPRTGDNNFPGGREAYISEPRDILDCEKNILIHLKN